MEGGSNYRSSANKSCALVRSISWTQNAYRSNEKFVKYGTTHVLAIGGYSGFILGLTTMPVKNNLIIYNQLFRPILQQFGLWDRILVDPGREFYLLLYAQEHLSYLKRNQMRALHVRSMPRELSMHCTLMHVILLLTACNISDIALLLSETVSSC